MPTRRVGIIRAGNEPKASGRATTRKKKIATYNGCPKGSHMDWVPYPVHMGPRFAGPITALRAFKKKKKNVVWCVETLGEAAKI